MKWKNNEIYPMLTFASEQLNKSILGDNKIYQNITEFIDRTFLLPVILTQIDDATRSHFSSR